MPDSEYNREQTLAIEHASGPLQVLAGPGSGKTFLTIRRVRHLIRHHGISPDKILVITFTKAAAAEMQERFKVLTEGGYPEVRFGTFHAVFYTMLRKYNNKYQLISYKEQVRYFKHIQKELAIKDDWNTEVINILLRAVSKRKNCLDREEYNDWTKRECVGEIAVPAVLDAYEGIMKEQNKIDFDDMIRLCNEMLEQNKEILAFWQNTFSHILIDEFQDISPLQYSIIRKLALPQNNLFVVGDDDQAIYGFRGAGPYIMKRFMKDYPNAGQLILSMNYRSSEAIVNASETIISENENRFVKKIKAGKIGTDPVKILPFETWEEETDYLTKLLIKMPEDARTQAAVIFRTNAEASLFAEKLAVSHIPFCVREKIRNLFEQPAAKDIFAYLSFAADNNRHPAGSGKRSDFLRIMNKPLRYISRDVLPEENVYRDKLMSSYGRPYMRTAIESLYSDLKKIASLPPYLAIDYVRKSIGYDFYMIEGKQKEEKEKLFRLADAVQQSAAGFYTFWEWKKYIEEYSDIISGKYSEKAKNKKGIHLLTMHASKGLEYETVFLLNIKTGNVPSKKALLPHETEEERRLFYVAVTRAKNHLEILYYGRPSPFLHELENRRKLTPL